MKKILTLSAVISTLCAASISAANFSWGVSIGIGGYTPVYTPPVVYTPTVVYVQQPIVQPVVNQVVYTTPVVIHQPVYVVPVVNYYRADCYRSPFSGTVWVGNAPRHHSHRR